ncbi:MAG: LON peptidase substrate-binding domain-containing protein [Candidatus Binatia bacterium]
MPGLQASLLKVGDEPNTLGSTRVIPVFPLSNVVLFPKIHLPLHIFEPRYRQMVKDTAENSRLIGMALLRGDWEKSYEGNPDIYPLGCVGTMVSITPFPDGRYNIVLYGLREYEVQEQILDQTLYRQATVLFREMSKPAEEFPVSLKREILDLVIRTEKEKESELVKILRDPSLDEETWLNFCCSSLNISILEKQTLLEVNSLEERAKVLLNVLRFKVAEKGNPVESDHEPKERKPPH